MRYAIVLIALFAAVATPLTCAQEMRLQRLTDNVHAVLQPEAQRFEDSNSLLIVTTEGVVVVDAQARRANVRRVMQLAAQLSDLPVVMVINTHWHPDHTLGNALYRQRYGDALTIVGHDMLFEELPGRAAPYLEEQVGQASARLVRVRTMLDTGAQANGRQIGAAGQEAPRAEARQLALRAEARQLAQWLAEHRDARFLAPSLSYDDFMRLQVGDVRIHLIHFRAHTGGDTVVWLPQEKIMATGDLLDDIPYVGDGYPSSWVNALHDIDTMNPRWMIPGHGRVLDDERRLEDIRAYLDALSSSVAALHAQGATLEMARQSLDFSGHRTRLAEGRLRSVRVFDALLGDAIESAWHEQEQPR